ncbi:hypothetical protein [Arsukibacterium sp.]|uniref:hypothetical protein n=1 Tax=Arsukibacterium sp. TaxID=1977258 RepID=UPI002FDA99AC
MRFTFILVLLLSSVLWFSPAAKATLITVGYSGVIEQNDYEPNLPVGTVIQVQFSFYTDGVADYVINSWRFPVFDIVLTMLGEQSTNTFGYLGVTETELDFQAGEALAGGGRNPFSNAIAGMAIRGIGFQLFGDFTQDILPGADEIYGLTGTFFVNRSIATLYDVNHPDLLQLPPQSTPPSVAVPAPATALLLLPGLLVLCRRRS